MTFTRSIVLSIAGKITLLGLMASAIFSCHQKSEEKEERDSYAGIQSQSNPYYSRTDTTLLNITDDEWKRVLPDSIYRVMRKKETERAFTGKYWDFSGVGNYYCASCGNRLFLSDAKFSSSCGWPTFFEPARKNSVRYQEDHSHSMIRMEVLCGRCGGHLGHLFKDGPPPTHNRYCMNSIAMEFEPQLLQP